MVRQPQNKVPAAGSCMQAFGLVHHPYCRGHYGQRDIRILLHAFDSIGHQPGLPTFHTGYFSMSPDMTARLWMPGMSRDNCDPCAYQGCWNGHRREACRLQSFAEPWQSMDLSSLQQTAASFRNNAGRLHFRTQPALLTV
jgi:hypothetical protein